MKQLIKNYNHKTYQASRATCFYRKNATCLYVEEKTGGQNLERRQKFKINKFLKTKRT